MRVTVFGRFRFSALLVVSSLLLVSILAAGQTVPTNQVDASTGIVYQNSVSVSFGTPQQAGGLNAVIVGWNDSSSTITSVTDTAGNTYFQAAGTMVPTAPPLDVSQAIYVASNIKGGANTVTVTFNGFTGAQDVRLIEYGGPPFIENTIFPMDTWVGLTGNSSPAATGTLTTTYANDVLVVGGTIDSAFTSINKPCGTGCTLFTEIGPAAPFFDIVADADVTALGAYQATAPTSGGGGGNFVMQMVALRVAGQTTIVNPAPTAASVLPATSGEAGGVPIAITGTGFLPGANVTVTGTLGVNTLTVSAVNCVVASATTINCVTPVFPRNTTNPSLIVTNPDGQATVPLPFAYTASTPFTTVAGNFSPTGGATDGGTPMTITGSDFASGATVVTVGGTRADKIVVVNSGTINAIAPAGSAGAQTITVTNPSGASGSPGQFTYSTGAGINFVQANSAGSTSVAFTLAQTAGDLNVVVMGWGDATSTITGVSDSAGNTYTAAVNTIGTGLTQAIWYAKNIKASASNTVTVTFNAGPASPDLRILEYSGLDTASPLDGSGVGLAGTGTFLDSGPVTVTGVGDMILGAGTVGGVITPAPNKACADTSCTFATALFTVGGNNVEHTFPTVAGPFDATANQDVSAAWVMQAVAFKQPSTALANFTVGATAPAAVSAGGSTTSTITVTPSGGFNSAVALTCTGLPSGASCAPLSLTPGASPATGTLTISTMATTPVGTTTVTITGTSGSVVNTTTVSLVVAAAGGGNFTLTATPASGTVTAGTSATSTINIVPSGGFTATVNLTCSITTTASPAPVCSIPATATTTATLTVSTTAATAALRRSTSIYYAALLPLFGMTLLGVSFGSRRKKVLGVLLVFLLVSGLIFLAACGGSSHSSGGGGNPGTPAGNYTVTVTGTSGSLTAQTTTFTLTVQ